MPRIDYVHGDGLVVPFEWADLWGEVYVEGHQKAMKSGASGPRAWNRTIDYIREHMSARARSAGVRLPYYPASASGKQRDSRPERSGFTSPRATADGLAEIAAHVYGGPEVRQPAQSMGEIDRDAIYAQWNARPAAVVPAGSSPASGKPGPAQPAIKAAGEIHTGSVRSLTEIDQGAIWSMWNKPKIAPAADGSS